MKEIDPALLKKYATGWNDEIGLRIFVGLVGFFVLAMVVRAIIRRRTSLISSVIWCILGGLLVAFSLYAQQMVQFVISTEYLMRFRVLMGCLSGLVLLITFESIRRTHLQERYALLWVATGMLILLTVFFPDAIYLLRAVTGMEYVTAIVSVAFTFLVLVAFHFSLSMSSMESDRHRTAQRMAVMEARLRELEDIVRKTK
ncbi:MAG: hypothetical protein C0404_10725 [Verrucomicrobia bacterium]|nr:hypothetical protein [Verrucomicrobiota bacterium]